MNDQQQIRADALTDAAALAMYEKASIAASEFDSVEAAHVAFVRIILAASPVERRAAALTSDQRQALGEAISEYFEKLDSDEGIRTPEGRILRAFDYCDSHNVDDLIDRAILPALATSANETGAEALGQFEHLDVQNHVLRRTLQRVMARLTDLLDEDQFGNIESIVKEAGVEPPAMAAAAPADERAAQGLLTIGRCMGIKAAVRYIDSAGLTTAIDHAAEIRKLADPERPRDCSRDPSSCPDNEGYGCWCSDQARAAASPAAEAVAWVRKHPDTGALSGDWLWNDAIEQCRKDSGVWFPLGFLGAPQPAQADALDEEAYVAKRMTETLATVYATIIGDDKVDDNDGLNAIERVVRAAQVLRLEVYLYRAQADAPAEAREPFQARVQPWMLECFGPVIAADRIERNHRFLEEALELVQSLGCTASEAHQLVDYTFGRPLGEPAQEVGGVMVTLAALCLANGLDMHAAGETELARISVPAIVEKIRAKQAAKPKHSPLPEAPASAPADAGEARLTDEQRTMLMQAADFLELKHSRLAAVALRALLNGADQ
ncbi:hypothetical protein [Burkholderia multivorans]|uniref:hypothetical protein n=1 Tax=Burkholderia multivorans TaxID=87883 RepID=UPI002ED4BA7F|nr:hypothetical protein V1241_16465 [Burkholderia multivorans]